VIMRVSLSARADPLARMASNARDVIWSPNCVSLINSTKHSERINREGWGEISKIDRTLSGISNQNRKLFKKVRKGGGGEFLGFGGLICTQCGRHRNS